jgi:hypothetical protein
MLTVYKNKKSCYINFSLLGSDGVGMGAVLLAL